MASVGPADRAAIPDVVDEAHADRLPPSGISFEDVSFAYDSGATQAISDLSFDVACGNIVSVIGPSGCGKSTLLSLVAGLIEADKGQVVVATKPQRHPLAMMFQGDTVLPWKTVQDNVAMARRFAGASRRQSREDVRSLLALVGLEHSAHAYPHQLSGGMRRRVQFVSAMAAEPDIMLLDEPFSALDEPTRVQVHQDVYTTLREFGTTALLVTHDIAEAISLSDRVLVLSRRPARVISHYDIPFGEQRSMLSLRRDSSFLELYSTIWASLSDIIVGPENVSASGSSVALPAAREGLESNGIGS